MLVCAVSMPPKIAAALGNQLRIHAPRSGLEDVTFKSFQRKWGFAPSLAAADCVHAVTAHLETRQNAEDTPSDCFW